MRTKRGFSLRRKRLASGAFHADWWVRFQFRGQIRDENSMVPMCASCAGSVEMPVDCVKRACRGGVMVWAEKRSQEMRRAFAESLTRPPVVPTVPAVKVPSVGEWLDCFYVNSGVARKDVLCARRAVTSAMRVICIALNLWDDPSADHWHTQLTDAEIARVRALPLTVLNHDLARKYFAVSVPDGMELEERAEHVTINSRMKQLREMFTPKAREKIYEGRLVLPECIERFLKYPLLAVPKSDPEPVVGERFDALMAAREALRATDADLYLCNKVLVQTALRSGSVVMMRADWVEHLEGDRWQLVVRERKHNTAVYAVPITPELAAEIQARPGFTFGDDEQARKSLVNGRHNEFLKSVAGAPKRGHQGNHRLRDTAAGAITTLKGKAFASAALGHASVQITIDYYARVGFRTTEAMRREYAAFLS